MKRTPDQISLIRIPGMRPVITFVSWHAYRWGQRLAAWTPKVTVLDCACAGLCYVSILFYRRFLSPVKGFRCAHAQYAGGPSCSDVAVDAFRHHYFAQAFTKTAEQFARCGEAARIRVHHGDEIRQAMEQLPIFLQSGAPITHECSCCPAPPPL